MSWANSPPSEGKLEEALENYRRSAELRPNDPQTYLYMGKALSLLKRTDESMQNFRRALELDGANWEAHYALGGELGMHGRFAEAKAEFQQVVRLQPQFAMGHLNLGVALFKLNDPRRRAASNSPKPCAWTRPTNWPAPIWLPPPNDRM